MLGIDRMQIGFRKFALASVALISNQLSLCRTTGIIGVSPTVNNGKVIEKGCVQFNLSLLNIQPTSTQLNEAIG